jgi:hypothetical protein
MAKSSLTKAVTIVAMVAGTTVTVGMVQIPDNQLIIPTVAIQVVALGVGLSILREPTAD